MAETRPLDGTHCWYFAYGANMNPESLEKRQCYPLESWPAKLNDWAMRFNVNGMMGNIEPSPGSSVHGVAHHFTHETMERMIEIEGGKDQFYHVIEVEAELYDGRKVPSLAFVGTKETVKPGMGRPTERYIKLLIEGARHAGLNPQYIRFLEGVDYVKRRTPSHYLKLPPPILQKTNSNKEAGREDKEEEENQGVQDEEECIREYTEQELKELHEEVNKADPLELAMAVAGWVIRVKLRGAGGWQTFLKLFGGKDSSFIMLQRLHDPTLPKVATPEEITEQHHAWLQDLIMGELGAAVYDLSTLQVLGKFVPSSSSSFSSSTTTTTTTTVNASCSSTTTTTTSTSSSSSPFGIASGATTTTTTTTSSSHL